MFDRVAMMTFRLVPAAVALALVICPAAAEAQIRRTSPSERPNRGLFGGGQGKTDQSLVLTGSATSGAEWFGPVDASDPSVIGAVERNAVPSTNWAGGAEYSVNRVRGSVDASAQMSGRYFPSYDGAQPVTRLASFDGTWHVKKRTAFNGNMALIYQPLSLTSLSTSLLGDDTYPSLPFQYSPDTGIAKYSSQTATLGVVQTLSKRASLEGNVDFSRSNFSLFGGQQSYTAGTVNYTYQFRRSLSWQLGYTRANGDYGVQAVDGRQRVTNQSLNAGINVDKALSLTRRTFLSFRTGSTSISDGSSTRFFITGDATLTHEIGRTWVADGTFSRQAGFVAGIRVPTVSDILTAGLSGLFNRRIQFNASAAAGRGTAGLVSSASEDYTAERANVGLIFALSRVVGIQADYSFNQYQFGGADVLVSPYSRQLRRHSVQVGLSLWAPILQRSRRSNASR